ncbi:ModE family transcriptional regulator, partial [Rhodospirillum rubrum]|nr:ModE family transcriptional regulator [Rhodospirillum rubrum]
MTLSPVKTGERLRLRLKLCNFAAMGPGKADLLDALEDTGSISAAARRTGLSYRKAWMLIDELNRAFRDPLVSTAFGGAGGGGARLTPTGATVLAAYRRLEQLAAQAGADEIALIQSLVAEEPAPPP